MKGPLDGVRVLALERAVAGPFGSMILGDLGAEVLKIEPPGGEQVRVTNPPPRHKGEPAFFLAFNRNKKSIVLDLMTRTGLQAFHDLVKLSDVVWDNNRPGVNQRLKVDYDTLRTLNPRIVTCSITGYGATGPYAMWPSYDIIAQGMAGLLLQTGHPGGPPVKPAPALADLAAAVYGALGVLSALWQRERTGEGQAVDVNLLDGAMALLAMHYAIYFLDGVVPRPIGAGHLQSAPFGAYKTKDGWITLGIGWPRVARTLGLEWMIDDPRFRTLDDRLMNRVALDAIINETLGTMDSATWLEMLRADDIPCGPMYNLDQAPLDPQVRHNGIVMDMEHSLGGRIKLVGNPIRMRSVEPSRYTPPPALGEHTREVLGDILGYSEERIGELQREQERHAAELKAHYRHER